MSLIETNSIGNAWLLYIKLVLEKGNKCLDDGIELIELDYCTLTIHNFSDHDTTIAKWGDSELIESYTKKLFNLTVTKPFKLSYGERLFNQKGFNQVDWIEQLLLKKRESKSACISLMRPGEKFDKVPCLSTISVKIRKDKLLMTCFFRSQNVMNSYANFISLRKLQSNLSKTLDAKLGRLTFFIVSPHIYLKDFSKAESLLNAASEQ